MDRIKLECSHRWLREELDRCVAVWLEHGMDPVHGGVYTCLDRKGEKYSSDKSVWMQGRCAWTFAHLCRIYGVKPEWLAASRSCLDFMEAHCVNRTAGGRMYFTVTAQGNPLRQRRYCFSEAFYAMANAEYYGITGERIYLERARQAYGLYWNLNHGMPDPAGFGPKTIPETRKSRSFGGPMIALNVTSVLLRADPEWKNIYTQRAQQCVEEMFRYHVKQELQCVLENVDEDGAERLYCSEGRVVNPGHIIEGVWFLLEHAGRTGDKTLVEKAARLFDWALQIGWDQEYGGLLYFTDCLGKPPESYEHDMKLWWPHNEALIASSMLYRDTGNEEYLDWFWKIESYCREHFADPEYGEWFGYLRRDGHPTMPPAKGSTFKGPFHVPRALALSDTVLGQILAARGERKR